MILILSIDRIIQTLEFAAKASNKNLQIFYY